MPLGLVFLVLALGLLAIFAGQILGAVVLVFLMIWYTAVSVWNFIWSHPYGFYFGVVFSMFVVYYYHLRNKQVDQAVWRGMNWFGFWLSVAGLVICFRSLWIPAGDPMDMIHDILNLSSDILWTLGYTLVILAILSMLGRDAGLDAESARPIGSRSVNIPWSLNGLRRLFSWRLALPALPIQVQRRRLVDDEDRPMGRDHARESGDSII